MSPYAGFMNSEGIYFFARRTRKEKLAALASAEGIVAFDFGSLFLDIYLYLPLFWVAVELAAGTLFLLSLMCLFMLGMKRPKESTLGAWQASGLQSWFFTWSEIVKVTIPKLSFRGLRQMNFEVSALPTGSVPYLPIRLLFKQQEMPKIRSFLVDRIASEAIVEN